jgi:GNAT superfamily N-acetyltransferase
VAVEPESLLGRRVVLRRRVGVRDGRVVYSDVLGDLTEVAADLLTVRRADGTSVLVPAEDVHRLRAIPPGAADILALEAVAARGWPAPETAQLGGWLLRAGGGWTRRANSALLLGDPGMPVPAALDRVRDWYAARGQPAVLAVPLPAQSPADQVAARLGWTAGVETHVLTRPLPPPPPADPGVTLATTLTPEWEAVYRARTVPPIGRRILTAPALVAFAELRLDGAVTAIGRGVVIDQWLGVAAVEVLDAYRRRGLAGRIMAALYRWGADHGARRCYLQVEAGNAPARALYDRLGFTPHHRYRHRAAP